MYLYICINSLCVFLKLYFSFISHFFAAVKIDEKIISVVATISSPVPTIQNIIDSITQPWLPSHLRGGNKYFTNLEQQHKNTTLNHIGKTTMTNSSSSSSDTTNRNVNERTIDEAFHVISSTELVSTQIPQSIEISSAMGSIGTNERHKSKQSTSTATLSKKQLIISRVSTHSDTPPLPPSPKLNKIFDTLSATSKHHHHENR